MIAIIAAALDEAQAALSHPAERPVEVVEGAEHGL